MRWLHHCRRQLCQSNPFNGITVWVGLPDHLGRVQGLWWQWCIDYIAQAVVWKDDRCLTLSVFCYVIDVEHMVSASHDKRQLNEGPWSKTQYKSIWLYNRQMCVFSQIFDYYAIVRVPSMNMSERQRAHNWLVWEAVLVFNRHLKM